MEGVPGTNRWPKWLRNLLWLAVAGSLVAAGALLRGLPDFLAGIVAASARNNAAINSIVLSLQTLILLAGAVYADRQLRAARSIAARTNTLTKIFDEHTDTTVVDARHVYRTIRDANPDRLKDYADIRDYRRETKEKWIERVGAPHLHVHIFTLPGVDGDDVIVAAEYENIEASEKAWKRVWRHLEKDWWDKRKAVAAVLNRYEAFAIGVEAKAIDERMYKQWWKTQLIEDWYFLRPLIKKLQSKNPRAYIAFQSLSERWQKDDTRELLEGRGG